MDIDHFFVKGIPTRLVLGVGFMEQLVQLVRRHLPFETRGFDLVGTILVLLVGEQDFLVILHHFLERLDGAGVVAAKQVVGSVLLREQHDRHWKTCVWECAS